MVKEKWPYKARDLLKEVQFKWIFYERTRKRWPFNAGDFLLAHLTQRIRWAIVTTERPSSVVRPSVNFSHFNQLLWSHWANLNQTLVEWSLDGPFQNCVRWSRLPTKMPAKLKIGKRGDEILIVHCCFMSSNFNCSYMARSSLTYIPGFSVKFFFQPIYTDYAN